MMNQNLKTTLQTAGPTSPQCWYLSRWSWDLLEESVVNQQLCGQRCQQGNADSQDEATAGPVKSPPQANGQRRQSQRQLDVVGKVHFLMGTSEGSISELNTSVNHRGGGIMVWACCDARANGEM